MRGPVEAGGRQHDTFRGTLGSRDHSAKSKKKASSVWGGCEDMEKLAAVYAYEARLRGKAQMMNSGTLLAFAYLLDYYPLYLLKVLRYLDAYIVKFADGDLIRK